MRSFVIAVSRIAIAATVLFPLAARPAVAANEIQWWHAMPGELGYQLDKLAADFNASQPDYKIVPTFKGLYTETMVAALFAQRLRQHPAIVQVAEVATATMMAAKSAIIPVHELMRDEKEAFDPAVYLPVVAGYYSDTSGRMLSFPFNASTPILYYNKDQFRAAGLDADTAPKTWPEVEAAAKKLRDANFTCGFTTHYPSWVLVENFAAYHNIPIATGSNGFEGQDVELAIDHPVIAKHFAALVEWRKSGIYVYGGRAAKAERKFYDRECAMFLGSSGNRADNLANVNFEVGYGLMPYWPDVPGAPRNTIIGGGSLWVLRDRPDAEYKGVAKFFAYLSRPDVQAKWHQATGYLPVTQAAYELTRSQGFYGKNPGTDISIRQITLNPPSADTMGLRLGSFVTIRDIIEDEMEQMLDGKKPPMAALKSAVTRGNVVLREFEETNK